MTPFPVPIQSLLQAAIRHVIRMKEKPSFPVPGFGDRMRFNEVFNQLSSLKLIIIN